MKTIFYGGTALILGLDTGNGFGAYLSGDYWSVGGYVVTAALTAGTALFMWHISRETEARTPTVRGRPAYTGRLTSRAIEAGWGTWGA